MVQKKCEYYGRHPCPPPYLDCVNCEVGDECQDTYWEKRNSSKQSNIKETQE